MHVSCDKYLAYLSTALRDEISVPGLFVLQTEKRTRGHA